jgi:hypothetical protein
LLFHQPLRQTEGFLGCVLKLMGWSLPCPDHTTLSRRNATLELSRLDNRGAQGPIDLIVDSTGLEVCGQGEWHAKKHGEKHRKSWTKLHINVDDQGWIIASTVTDDHQQAPSQVPASLAQVDRQIERFIGAGIYDQEPVYAAVAGHSSGAKVIIPVGPEILVE